MGSTQRHLFSIFGIECHPRTLCWEKTYFCMSTCVKPVSCSSTLNPQISFSAGMQWQEQSLCILSALLYGKARYMLLLRIHTTNSVHRGCFLKSFSQVLQLELLVLHKKSQKNQQINATFKDMEIYHVSFGKREKKLKREKKPDVGLAASLAVCPSNNERNVFGLCRGGGRCPCWDSSKSWMD